MSSFPLANGGYERKLGLSKTGASANLMSSVGNSVPLGTPSGLARLVSVAPSDFRPRSSSLPGSLRNFHFHFTIGLPEVQMKPELWSQQQQLSKGCQTGKEFLNGGRGCQIGKEFLNGSRGQQRNYEISRSSSAVFSRISTSSTDVSECLNPKITSRYLKCSLEYQALNINVFKNGEMSSSCRISIPKYKKVGMDVVFDLVGRRITFDYGYAAHLYDLWGKEIFSPRSLTQGNTYVVASNYLPKFVQLGYRRPPEAIIIHGKGSQRKETSTKIVDGQDWFRRKKYAAETKNKQKDSRTEFYFPDSERKAISQRVLHEKTPSSEVAGCWNMKIPTSPYQQTKATNITTISLHHANGLEKGNGCELDVLFKTKPLKPSLSELNLVPNGRSNKSSTLRFKSFSHSSKTKQNSKSKVKVNQLSADLKGDNRKSRSKEKRVYATDDEDTSVYARSVASGTDGDDGQYLDYNNNERCRYSRSRIGKNKTGKDMSTQTTNSSALTSTRLSPTEALEISQDLRQHLTSYNKLFDNVDYSSRRVLEERDYSKDLRFISPPRGYEDTVEQKFPVVPGKYMSAYDEQLLLEADSTRDRKHDFNPELSQFTKSEDRIISAATRIPIDMDLESMKRYVLGRTYAPAGVPIDCRLDNSSGRLNSRIESLGTDRRDNSRRDDFSGRNNSKRNDSFKRDNSRGDDSSGRNNSRRDDSSTANNLRRDDSSRTNNVRQDDSSRTNNLRRDDSPRRDNSRRDDSPRRDNSRRDDSPRRDNSRRDDSPRRENSKRNDSSRRDSSRRDDVSRQDNSRRDDSCRRDNSWQDGSTRGNLRRDDSSRRDSSRRNDSSRRDNSSWDNSHQRDISRLHDSSRRDNSRLEDSLRRDNSRLNDSFRRDNSRSCNSCGRDDSLLNDADRCRPKFELSSSTFFKDPNAHFAQHNNSNIMHGEVGGIIRDPPPAVVQGYISRAAPLPPCHCHYCLTYPESPVGTQRKLHDYHQTPECYKNNKTANYSTLTYLPANKPAQITLNIPIENVIEQRNLFMNGVSSPHVEQLLPPLGNTNNYPLENNDPLLHFNGINQTYQSEQGNENIFVPQTIQQCFNAPYGYQNNTDTQGQNIYLAPRQTLTDPMQSFGLNSTTSNYSVMDNNSQLQMHQYPSNQSSNSHSPRLQQPKNQVPNHY